MGERGLIEICGIAPRGGGSEILWKANTDPSTHHPQAEKRLGPRSLRMTDSWGGLRMTDSWGGELRMTGSWEEGSG